MELKIFWTNFSQNELFKILEYHQEKAGLRVAKSIVNGIFKETNKLKKFPKIGQVEELLENRIEEFRYLVFKNYKIIYSINQIKGRVEIHDIFDTRQNPIKIERNY